MLREVGRNKRRRRVTNKVRHLSSSARRRLWEQAKVANLGEVHNQGRVSRSRLRLVEDSRVRRAANEKECRGLVVSRLRRNSNRNSASSSNSAVVSLPQPIVASHKASRRAGSRDNQKKRHRHGHINFGAITPAAPERESPEPLFA